MANRVPFQRWRVIWWTSKMEANAIKYRDVAPEVSAAYMVLVGLGKSALGAIRLGQQDRFLNVMDKIVDFDFFPEND